MDKTNDQSAQKPSDAATLAAVAELAARMRSLLLLVSAPFPAGSLADAILRDAAAAEPHISRAIEIARELAKKETPAP